MKAIAKRLNDEGAPSPRAQQGRSAELGAERPFARCCSGDLYRGRIAWNRTRKRDQWGAASAGRPPGGRLDRRAGAAVARSWRRRTGRRRMPGSMPRGASTSRARGGARSVAQPWESVEVSADEPARCAAAAAGRSKCDRGSHGKGRSQFYGCAWYHDRGRTACQNHADVPMADANDIVIEALLDDVLDATLLTDAVDEAIGIIHGDTAADRGTLIDAELRRVEHERQRLMTAIADRTHGNGPPRGAARARHADDDLGDGTRGARLITAAPASVRRGTGTRRIDGSRGHMAARPGR